MIVARQRIAASNPISQIFFHQIIQGLLALKFLKFENKRWLQNKITTDDRYANRSCRKSRFSLFLDQFLTVDDLESLTER